jgi:hypothetical protein
MATKTIAQLTAATTLAASNVFEMDNGASFKVTGTQLANLLLNLGVQITTANGVLIEDDGGGGMQIFQPRSGSNICFVSNGQIDLSANGALIQHGSYGGALWMNDNFGVVFVTGAAATNGNGSFSLIDAYDFELDSDGSGGVQITTTNIAVNGSDGYSGSFQVLTALPSTFTTLTFTNGILTGVV